MVYGIIKLLFGTDLFLSTTQYRLDEEVRPEEQLDEVENNQWTSSGYSRIHRAVDDIIAPPLLPWSTWSTYCPQNFRSEDASLLLYANTIDHDTMTIFPWVVHVTVVPFAAGEESFV